MNILSIDFDWIMSPSINAYNHFSKPQMNWTYNTWRNIDYAIPEGDFRFSSEQYSQLISIILNFKKNHSRVDIAMGLNHNEILYAIEDWKLDKEQLHLLCNIDHHHDCGYRQSAEDSSLEYTNVIESQGADLSNWVYFFCKNYQINNYIWVKNKNSNLLEPDTKLPNSPLLLQSADINILDNLSFDKLFICLSPDWVPPKYIPLYNVIENIVNYSDQFQDTLLIHKEGVS